MAPLSSHHIHGGHGEMIAEANIADGVIDFCYFIHCGSRLSPGQMVPCRASVTRLYLCKKQWGLINMNVAGPENSRQLGSNSS